MSNLRDDKQKQWFVMRDLTRRNAKMPAYRMLENLGFRYFTPMTWKLVSRNQKAERQQIPFIQDLIFVNDSRAALDPLVARIHTFQYRYIKGNNHKPMTVRDEDMERFIQAVNSTPTPRYYLPSEITPDMYHRRIRITGGQLDGFEGFLLTTRGSKTRRLLVEIPTLLAAAVDVKPEYIQLIED